MDYLSLYSSMLVSRYFEETVDNLGKEGRIYGTYHLSIGQEGVHAGVSAALSDTDWIVPTHRCHGYNTSRGSDLCAMFSEMLGSRHGLCGGIGGSMHMTDVNTHDFGSSAVVGSGISIAGGIALAEKLDDSDSISVAIFGDGASSRGTLYEMMNLASIWNLPLLFVLENNHYGMSASSDRMIATDSIYKRADGFSIESERIDGNDVLAVYEAVKKAREKIVREKRPYFIEAETYRMCGHSRSDKRLYRTEAEEKDWKAKDPIARFRSFLLDNGFSPDSIRETETEARKRVSDALEHSLKTADERLSYEELSSLVYAPYETIKREGKTLHKASYREAVREALHDILSYDSGSFIMGEDIGKYGGCFGVTGDLYREFPGRVLETPVSEEAFTGMAVGAAAMGKLPIVEVMYGDFSTLSSDAIINHAAKLHFMSAGQLKCPMIYRTPIGGGTGHGAQHTQCLETMFLSIPGLFVVAPSDSYSAKALLKSAARMNNPVLFFEHKALYNDVSDTGDEDAFLPIGKAIVHRGGAKLLVIGYSRPFRRAMQILEDLRDEITFIDLATISPLDEETLSYEFIAINNALIVQDTPLIGSVGESVLRVLSSCSVYKPGNVRILSSERMPLPVPRALEMAVLPSDERIRRAAEEMLSL